MFMDDWIYNLKCSIKIEIVSMHIPPLVSFQSIINCARVISWKVEGFKLFKGEGNDISNNTSFSVGREKR